MQMGLMLLTVGSFFRWSQNHVEGDRERRAHNQEFEHEVVKRVSEDDAEGLANERFSVVVAEMFGPLWKVCPSKTGI